MKKISSLIIAAALGAALCLALAIAGSRTASAENPSLTQTAADQQLRIIADNSDIWLKDAESAAFGFAVTDLDQNGRLEIIGSACQGTGLYTTSQIWEVNEQLNGIEPLPIEIKEGDSQADIMVPSVPVFFDSANHIYYYIFDDVIRNGAAEYYENKRAVFLQDGKIQEKPLAFKHTLYSDPNTKTGTVTITDADNRTIDEKTFEDIGSQVFSKLEKHQAHFSWSSGGAEAAHQMNNAEMVSALTDSYRHFSIE